MSFEENLAKARDILAGKNSGPSGVLAFVRANAFDVCTATTEKGQTYQYNMPYVNIGSDAPLETYFAVVKSDRVGIEVVSPPGGTQDIIFDLNGKQHYAELVKPAKQLRFLADKLGIEEAIIDDETFVAHLLSSPRVSNLHLELAFNAAVRETAEEHGYNYDEHEGLAALVHEGDYELLSKRSFDTEPPTPVSQKIFVVDARDFSGVIPLRTDKTETKIEEREGLPFYEQGDFMSIRQLDALLRQAQYELTVNDKLPKLAHRDYAASKRRVEMIREIDLRLG